MDSKWYAVRTFPGYEFKVEDNLKGKLNKGEITKQISDVYIPEKLKYVFVRKKLKLKKEIIFPGTIFIKMIMNNETMSFVRRVQYVTGYFGKNENKKFPDSVEEFEMDKMRELVQDIDMILEKNQLININTGTEILEAQIQNIDIKNEKIEVLINNEQKKYDFSQIEKR